MTRGVSPRRAAAMRARQARALDLIRGGMTVTAAAAAIGVWQETVSGWRRFPAFASALDEAKAAGAAVRAAADHRARARILGAIRAGASLRDAAEAEGYARPTLNSWRRTVPGFADALDQARRDARARDPRKAALLDAIARGATVTRACAIVGIDDGRIVEWRRRDPAFAEQYARLMGPTGRPRTPRKLARILRRVEAGETVWRAAVAERLGPDPVGKWRRTQPELWALIVAAYERSGRRPPVERPRARRAA